MPTKPTHTQSARAAKLTMLALASLTVFAAYIDTIHHTHVLTYFALSTFFAGLMRTVWLKTGSK